MLNAPSTASFACLALASLLNLGGRTRAEPANLAQEPTTIQEQTAVQVLAADEPLSLPEPASTFEPADEPEPVAVPEPVSTLVPTATHTATQELTISEEAALSALCDASDGSNWLREDGRSSDAPIGWWFGDSSDADRVVALSLRVVPTRMRVYASQRIEQ